MALLHLVYRDQLFPRDAYRRTFDALLDALDERQACRRMVGLLALAHDRCCEAALAARLAELLEAGTLPELEPLEGALRFRSAIVARSRRAPGVTGRLQRPA